MGNRSTKNYPKEIKLVPPPEFSRSDPERSTIRRIAFEDHNERFPHMVRLMKRPKSLLRQQKPMTLAPPRIPATLPDYLLVHNTPVCHSCLNRTPLHVRQAKYHRSPSSSEFVELVEVSPTRMYQRPSAWSLPGLQEDIPSVIPSSDPAAARVFTHRIMKSPSLMSHSEMTSPFGHSDPLLYHRNVRRNSLTTDRRRVTFAPNSHKRAG